MWQDPDGTGPLPGAYVRLTTDGVFNGSALLIGTAANPIRIHGPVTFTQDVAIKGVIQGQGTIYTGRNTHIIGSLRYANPPDFTGTNMQTIENRNEKRDFLGIAARGSVIMGNPVTFANPYPLKYMTPPFTKGRFDEAGNWIPPFDAMQIDSTGRRRFQSVIPDNVINANAEGVNQVDAILYTNFVGGGNVGTSGGGMTLNGTLIARDEAIVTWSLPIRMNYDTRIRERGPTRRPLIDLNLPRSPAMLRSAGKTAGSAATETWNKEFRRDEFATDGGDARPDGDNCDELWVYRREAGGSAVSLGAEPGAGCGPATLQRQLWTGGRSSAGPIG